jgi:hypothetical protein
MKEVIEFAKQFIAENPQLKEEVLDLVSLCRSEIEEGGSPQHEMYLCIESIKQLKEEEQ